MSEFTVKIFLFFVLSSSLFGADKLSLGILRFEAGSGVSKEFVENIREAIISNFLRSSRFTLITDEKLNKIYQVSNTEGLVETRQAVKAGRTLDAKRLLLGSISRTNDRHYVSLRLIDVEQSKISLSDSWSAPRESDLIRTAARIFAEIEARTPLLGQIIKVNDRTTVLLDLGEEDGVRKDYAVSFLRFGEEIREPVSGESLGREFTSLGKGKIKSLAGGQMSTATIDTNFGLQVGDRAEVFSAKSIESGRKPSPLPALGAVVFGAGAVTFGIFGLGYGITANSDYNYYSFKSTDMADPAEYYKHWWANYDVHYNIALQCYAVAGGLFAVSTFFFILAVTQKKPESKIQKTGFLIFPELRPHGAGVRLIAEF